MGEGVLQSVFDPAAPGWTGAAVGAVFGVIEWFFLPRMMEASIRGSREAQKLGEAQLEGVVSWWKTVIRVFAVSMPVVGFALATVMAE